MRPEIFAPRAARAGSCSKASFYCPGKTGTEGFVTIATHSHEACSPHERSDMRGTLAAVKLPDFAPLIRATSE
jgi:hypothetical protein